MSDCCHSDIYRLPKPWPTGDIIEVCNCCGRPRAWTGVGLSNWLQIDLYAARREVQQRIDTILKSVRSPYGEH